MSTSLTPQVSTSLLTYGRQVGGGAAILLLCALWFSLALIGQAHATVANTKPRPKAFNLAEAREVVDTIARDERLTALGKACPADVFARELPWWRRLIGIADIPRETCAAKPRRCLERCLTWANSEACFRLAQVIEEHDDVLEEYQKEALFTRACALGMGAGCTNRAAGIRNGGFEKDPFRRVPEAERNACFHRTFKVDCEYDGAWGCAMLGQTYQLGEGVEADLAKAREAFEKSCTIDADFAACDFAKEGIEAMDKPITVEPEVIEEIEKGK